MEIKPKKTEADYEATIEEIELRQLRFSTPNQARRKKIASMF